MIKKWLNGNALFSENIPMGQLQLLQFSRKLNFEADGLISRQAVRRRGTADKAVINIPNLKLAKQAARKLHHVQAMMQ